MAAFLDTLAHAEGTTRFGFQDGYNVLVGGKISNSYDNHPRQLVWLPSYQINSSAAGRYQFLTSTWDDLVERFGIADFTPASQDLGAVQLIRECKALSLIHDGRIRDAIHACRNIWASLSYIEGKSKIAMIKFYCITSFDNFNLLSLIFAVG
ncbi:Lysozyme [Vreelandella boliviensis LC1]|uniref:Lysozyme n=1 Tax=Vreelandella boliviensis LC1 TaxID=1072583 RepID=A0A7U9GFR1_9GAMM|nr:Lysozyme [Halomonas boliviensis LC1]